MAKAKKKSKRFNYRLAAICGLLLVIAVGIVGGALVLKMKGGAERNMREARQYQEAGQYALAADYYGRVVHKQPGNREALQGILDCYQYIVPDTAESAGNLYRSYLRVLRQAALHASPEEQEQRSSDLLEEQYKAAILSGSSGFWQSLSDTADEIIARTNDDSDLLARAYFLRAISELSLKDEQLTEDIDGLGNIRFPGESYLQKHLEMRPESDNGWAKMAFGQMAVARRLGLESRYAQEERNLALAKETFEKAKELNPQGVWTLLEVMRDAYVEQLWYIGKSIRDPGSVSDEQSEQLRELVRESLAEAEAAVLSEATDDPIAVIDIVRYLRLADGFDGESRAIKILEKALEHDPDSNRLKYELGLSQYAEGLLEDAAATAMGLIEAEPLGISLEAQTQWGYRILATKLAFDTQHMIFVRSTGEERQAALDQMEALREQIYELTGEMDDNPIVLQVDGKLASSDQRWTEAAALFERAIDKGAKDAMVLRLDASALEKSGQTGLAEQRFREALQSEPSDLRNHLSLAEFYARTRQPEKGLALLERLPMRVIESNELLNSTYQSLSLLASGTEVVPDGISDPILLDLANADRALNDEDFSTAMAVLRAGSEKKEDVRYYVAMAHVQSMSGDSEKAIGFIDDALGLQPENDRLKLLRIQYGDPVQGVIEYCNDRYSDELEREAMIYENLRSLARVRDGLAEDFDSEGDAEAAADARLIAEKAREAMKDYQAAADGAVNTVAGAFIGKFEEYLKEGKFEEARAMLPVAREKNFDKAEGNLAEARVELSLARKAAEEGRPNQELLQRGIAAADRGTKLAPWSDLAWRTLGWGREMQGDLAAAERAYSESYRLNPANLATLKKLASLLLGNEAEQVRAVGVLREGAVQFPNDEYIRDLWLEAESRYGDPLVALTQRRQSFKENPDNRENAIRLAAMLARFNPSFELMVDDDGKRLMTSRQWLGLSDVRQAEILANLQAVWDKQMDDILAMIESDKDESFGQAILHAQVHVDRQQVESAITVLRDYLRNHSTDENRSGQTRAAAQFLIESGRTDEAVALLEEAIDSQSDEMEIDAALGSVLYASGIYGDAIPYLQSAVDAGEEDLYRHRLIESLLRTQQFDEGRAALAALKAESGNTYESYMLEAFLANRESILAGASGDASAESTGIDRYRTSLQAAMLEGPEMSRPYELLVESYLSDYLKTRDEALLTLARNVIDNAGPEVRESEALMLSNADVLEAQNNNRRAVQDMESYLRSNPQADAVRDRLIAAHVNSGSPDRALDVIRAAIVINPDSPQWREKLGMFLEDEGDVKGASQAYTEAFELYPSQGLLLRLSDATRSAEPWDHEGILKMIQKHQRLLEKDAILQSIHAKSLARLGAEAQSRSRIRQAKDTFDRQIALQLLPRATLRRWYEDLQIVFANDDPAAGEAFALDLIEGEPSLDDLAGLAIYWSRWASPDAWEKALAYQKQAVEKARAESPELLLASLSMLGSMELTAGDENAAAGTFKEIVDLTPNDAMALNNYAYLLATRLDQPAEAMPYAEQAIRLSPENSSIIDTVATIHSLTGNQNAALTARLSQLEYTPQDAGLLAKIALLYADHTDTPEKAVSFAERATSLRPRDARMTDVEGWAAFKAGRVAKGEDLVLQSIRRQPTARAHLHLAEIYLSQNRVEKAREQLRSAVEIADDESIKARATELETQLSNGG